MRKAIKILLVLFFIPLFMAFLILINLQVTFFSSEFVKERLQESGIYKKVLDQSYLLIPIFPMEETKISDFSDLSSKKVKGLIDESVKPRDVQKMSETVIDQVHEIFSGRSSDYVVKIRLASLSLLIPSVMVFIYSLLSSLIISRFSFRSLGGLDSVFPEEMGQVVINSFKSSVAYLFLLLRWESLALTILAALALILSYRMKPRLT